MSRIAERAVKPCLFMLLAAPFVALVVRAFQDQLGANPVETLTHETGEWALRLMFLTLALTPARMWLRWNGAIRLRRMCGLYAFFYAVMHFTTYLWLDQFFDIQAIVEDIVKRPYITIGFAAVVVMVPLALTSTNNMIKRLGGARWRTLHRLAYVAAILGAAHFIWLVKADYAEPLIYAGVLAILLLARLPWRRWFSAKPSGTIGG
ncbi:MAG: sulfoxide reductase heme-binding subunit YedZ [Gammaproteobacteria bacterium]|nr:sulfoxide reductase heme-binding subunit YedZ [Gammaproteobacteria bacterium]